MNTDPADTGDPNADDGLAAAQGGIDSGGTVIGSAVGGTTAVPVTVAVNELTKPSSPTATATAGGGESTTLVSGDDDYLGGGFYEDDYSDVDSDDGASDLPLGDPELYQGDGWSAALYGQ